MFSSGWLIRNSSGLPHKSAAPHRKPPQQCMTLDPKPKENMPSNVELIYAQMRLSALVIQKGGCHLNQATTQGFFFFFWGCCFFPPLTEASLFLRFLRAIVSVDLRPTHAGPPLPSRYPPAIVKVASLRCSGRLPRASSLSRGELIRRGVCPHAAWRSLGAD